ncbi:hypothetical protein BD779DRAFT_744681 [Infundibulicybe gibba]|nr:hypothetical protein BD779DRAFT_744681 [Infundibulicybe gibba]
MKYLAALYAFILSQAMGSLAQSTCTSTIGITALGTTINIPVTRTCPTGTVCCSLPPLNGSGGLPPPLGSIGVVVTQRLCLTQAACTCATSGTA